MTSVNICQIMILQGLSCVLKSLILTKFHSLLTGNNTSSIITSSTSSKNESSAFMDQLEYISKCRATTTTTTASDGGSTAAPPSLKRSRALFSQQQNELQQHRETTPSDAGSNTAPPSSKRSRVLYSQQQNELQQHRERTQRELQQQQQRQQECLRKQEQAAAAQAMAQQHQQREQFINNMRARQHQERQAALSSLAAANLASVYRHQPTHQLTRYGAGTANCCWPTYGGTSSQTLSNSGRHQLHQMSSFQQITPPGSMPFCWAPGPAHPPSHIHPSATACPPTCCQEMSAPSCRSASCSSLFQGGRHPQGTYGNPDKASYDLMAARSKQAAMAMACCYGSNQTSSHLVPPPMACAATPALTGGNPVAAAAAAAAMAGAAYCLGCVQGKCQVTWNKENAVNNGIMRSL